MIKLSKSAGFSLVELMIVVAIIAILAAIAIPSFLKFQLKAKEAEARNNLAAIRTCEESYRAEEDVYAGCGPAPAAVPSATTSTWVDANTNGNLFADIGFTPSGKVRFQYGVVVPDPAISYTATAAGKLDGTTTVTFTMTNTDPKPTRTES